MIPSSPARHRAWPHLHNPQFHINTSLRRPFSSSHHRPQSAASLAAARFLDNLSSTILIRRQLIDGNQLQKLAISLNRPLLPGNNNINGPHNPLHAPPPLTGTPLPPAYHLVYFTPSDVEAELGADGSDQAFNAPAPFTRRMWAGGSMRWPSGDGGERGLRVGDEVEERTRVLGAAAKRSRDGGEMVLVDVEKEIWGPRGLAVVDQRSWIFRPMISEENHLKTPSRVIEADVSSPSMCQDVTIPGHTFPIRHMSWSPVGLFRFSALTFNSHKIHYNEPWTRTAEGHPGVVVHGPLNLISLLDYWRDVHGGAFGQCPREVAYRAVSPVYAGEKYQIRTGEMGVAKRVGDGDGDGQTWEVLAERGGVVIMRASISAGVPL